MKKALVIGGTGPSGPGVVNGLLDRGYEVTILHSGAHEFEFDEDVEHIHADAHVKESLEEALSGRIFDVAAAMYGRLRVTSEVLAGKADHVVAVGGVFYKHWINDQFHRNESGEIEDAPIPPYTFPPVPMPETAPMDDNPNNGFAQAGVRAERRLFEVQDGGGFAATLLRFPRVYGERAMAPIEWSIVRRALDRRPVIILPDGGLALESKLYARNAALAVLLAIDNRRTAAGEIFNVADSPAMTLRQWATVLSRAVGYEPGFLSVPYDLAAPSFVYARDPWMTCHRALDISKIAERLGYRPPESAEMTLTRTARHYAEHPLQPGGEAETQLDDPFDYEAEDMYIAEWETFAGRLSDIPFRGFRYEHPYRHPSAKEAKT